MLIASVDIETTGLDPEFCQVLELGVVLWDTNDDTTPVPDLESFHCYCAHKRIQGEAYALQMNQKILERIAKREPGYTYLPPEEVGHSLRTFIQNRRPELLEDNGFGIAKLWPTGFNFDRFDLQFLTRLPEFSWSVQFHHRSLAPATLFFLPDDPKIPGSDQVFERAGVTVPLADRHTALGDARGVIEVLRSAFHKGPASPVTRPKCPECGGRTSIRKPTDHGEYDTLPCPTCNRHDMFGFPCGGP